VGQVSTLRVMIVDDHPLLRGGIRRVLEAESDLEVVGEASDGKEAISMALELEPDIVLMDINLPTMNGLQATRELKTLRPDIGVIVFTAYHDETQALHAIQAGASAYFPKDVTAAELVNAIREVSQGNYVIDDTVLAKPEVAKWLLKQFQEVAPIQAEDALADELFLPLSPREMEILQLIARGLSNKEIAKELKISRQTVKNHMTSILRKLAVNDRTQAAVYALRRGWIRLQDTQ
jgi:DNA-binding NarL/FixJ family response regulator